MDKISITDLQKELNSLESELNEYERVLMEERKESEKERRPVHRSPRSEVSSNDVAKLQTSIRELSSQIEDMNKRLSVLEELHYKLGLLDEMDEELNYMKNMMESRLNVDFKAMYSNVLEQMNIEAIKIYRNVQAVVVEEQAKQNRVLFGVDGKSDKLKFRMNHVMIFSIISFVVSILVMLIQILPALGIEIF